MFKNINCKNLPSLRRNIVYQFLYELLIVFIPLFTIPYVSRVLGAENIGLFSYTYAVANYFVLFANLGIKNYGSRTIAMVRNNKEELNRNFSEILSIHIIFSIIVIFVYLVLLFFFVEDNLVIFLIQSIYIFAAVFDINWFFFGIEKFKLTVGRNTLVKILSVFLVLVFVKTQTDLWIYALILALSVFVGQSVVWFALKQYVSWRRPSWANMKQHIRPLFVLFLPILALSLYKYMDKIMLGSISSNVQVGFYENAEKIINVPMSLIMAFGVVLMPRIANMVTSKDKGEVFKLIDMSMEAVMLLAIAISFGLAGISFVLAPIFFGYEFEECGILIMGLAVTLPFMAFANVIRTQYLIPYKEDKIFVVSLFLGAAVNLIVNIILIPYMAARGAVIGTIFAEIIVCIYQSYFVRKKIFIKKYLLNTIPPILIGIVMFVFVFQIGNVMNINIVTLILQLVVGMFIYAVGVFLLMLKSRTRLMVLLRKFVVRY